MTVMLALNWKELAIFVRKIEMKNKFTCLQHNKGIRKLIIIFFELTKNTTKKL